ncbi:MAG TPA: FHA domain-containing protein, partial [Planctomycetota bacterium]|nr:FHA domain-containing protein [Planctomycetota bacterium]
MPALVVEANKQRIPLDQASVTIGSGDKSMIQIQDAKLGPIHCQIVKTTAGFKVISIDQKVGTLINGVRVREQGLKGGDVIQIGDTRFIFQEDGVPRPTARIAGVPPQPPPGTQRIAGIPPRPQTARIAGIPATPAAPPRPTTARIPQAP